MSGYIEGPNREQSALFLERLEDWIDEIILFAPLTRLLACLIWLSWPLTERRWVGWVVRSIIRRFCWSSTSTVIWTRCSRVD